MQANFISTISHQLQLVLQALQQNQLQRAEDLCQQVLQIHPNQPNALYFLGIIAYQRKEHSTAIQFIQQAITRQPTLLEAQYNLAIILKETKRYKEAVTYYEKALAKEFSLKSPLILEKMLAFLCSVPTHRWQDKAGYIKDYSNCLYQAGLLQKIASKLSKIINKNLILKNFKENEAQLIVFSLLQFLQFDKLTEREWNRQIFEQVALPIIKQALQIGYYNFALHLENVIYANYVLQVETEENFSDCFAQWSDEMCVAGKKVKATLPPFDQSILNSTIPTIGFFVHKASSLAHVEKLLVTLEGLAQLEYKPFKVILYFLSGYNENLLIRCQKSNISTIFLSQIYDKKGVYEILLILRQQIIQDKVSAIVWVSLATLMPFAFSMRVAPVQIWWSMKYHSLSLEDIDGYLTRGLNQYKKIGNRVWRAAPGSSENRFDASLTLEAQRIRQQDYGKFKLVTAAIGREEKLADPIFLETICRILKANPQVAFLWTGRVQLPQIQQLFETSGVMNQCFFIGWVNTKLYAQVIDLFLDSFPFPCGKTLVEAMAAEKACIFYNSPEAYETGIHGVVRSLLDFPEINQQACALFNELYQIDTDEKLYFCADTPAEYENYANQLINNYLLRNKSGKANKKFVELFYKTSAEAAIAHAVHFIDIIREKAIQQFNCDQLLL